MYNSSGACLTATPRTGSHVHSSSDTVHTKGTRRDPFEYVPGCPDWIVKGGSNWGTVKKVTIQMGLSSSRESSTSPRL